MRIANESCRKYTDNFAVIFSVRMMGANQTYTTGSEDLNNQTGGSMMPIETVETTDIGFDHFFGFDLSGPEWEYMREGYAISPFTNSIVKFADEYDKLTNVNRLNPRYILWMEHEDICGIHQC